MKKLQQFFFVIMPLCACLLAGGCGIKPKFVDPPPGVDPDPYPRTYPNPATDPAPDEVAPDRFAP